MEELDKELCYKSVLMKDQLLYSIVDKLVSGRSDWTLEELQFQRNYPREIEQALMAFQHGQHDKANKWSIIHSGHNLLQRGGRRGLTYPEAIVLALVASTQLNNNSHVAVFAYDDDFLDMAVVIYADGVVEVVYTAYSSLVNRGVIYSICHDAVKRLEEPIDRVLVVTNGYYGFTYEQLAGSIFGVEAKLMTNQKELLRQGIEVQKGIREGNVKDVLLLSVIPQTIGIEDADGKMLPIILSNTTIPTKRSDHIIVDAASPRFSVEIWQGNNEFAKNNALIASLNVVNERIQAGTTRELEIVINLDSNMGCRCCLIDTATGRKNELIV